MKDSNSVYAGALLLAVAGIAAGCSLVAGLEPAQLYDADAGIGGANSSSTESTGAKSSSVDGTSTSASQATSSSASGSAEVCTPAATSNCYDGPPKTSGVGLCKGGQETCNPAGTAFGPCNGEIVPSPETCASGTDQNCDGFKCVLWSELFDNAVISGVAFDSKSDVFVVGSFSGVLTFGNAATLISFGEDDIFLAKLGPSGAPVWAAQFGDPDSQEGSSVAVDSDGNVVLGGTSNTGISFGGPTLSPGIVVAKFTNDGTPVWSKGLAGRGGNASSMATTATGDVVVGGSFGMPINFGDGTISALGSPDVFVAKLRASDGSGKVADGFWGHTYGAANSSGSMSAVALDPAGSVLFAGYFHGTINLGKGPMSALGTNDSFLGKLTDAGAPSWQTQFASANAQSLAAVSALTVDATGGPIVGGGFFGSANLGSGVVASSGGGANENAFLAHFDSSGGHLWDMEYASTLSVIASLAMNSSGDFVATGIFKGTLNLGGSPLIASAPGDGFLVKLRNGPVAATFEWNRQFVGLSGALPVAEMPTGNSLIGGVISQTTDFGTGPLSPPPNGASLFFAEFNP